MESVTEHVSNTAVWWPDSDSSTNLIISSEFEGSISQKQCQATPSSWETNMGEGFYQSTRRMWNKTNWYLYASDKESILLISAMMCLTYVAIEFLVTTPYRPNIRPPYQPVLIKPMVDVRHKNDQVCYLPMRLRERASILEFFSLYWYRY
jgi:hypothetical protein